ncbi:DUF417 domain-containing protein [Sphingobacterium alkalisoli]|uniref:DUF417 domain-containing protein n=1 Tax=Sphingobacterium alkalisoli TaxID=1874115 RepID=A0A4U0H5P5_9SPHI|nr:DUF417 family protein [Sphingobacterium alkalisoli]TJY67071.1 DUF417 domain-containing protein [Sphingobacterium alkalisoli]
MEKFLSLFVNSQKQFINLMRGALFLVMVWIGGLKAYQYEADGIVPFVINSPLMNFFYQNTDNTTLNGHNIEVSEYTLHKNPEGKMVQKNVDWHKQNGTYVFSYALGLVIVTIGSLVLLGIWFPKIGFLGGLLTTGMSLVTLSFLITTPEVFVPNLGGDFPTPHYGFPYLSGAGRLVLKDIIMLAGGLIVASEAAVRILHRK